jgi:hypothetical protein
MSQKSDIQSWQAFLDVPEFNLRHKFVTMYYDLLKASAENDLEKIGKLCEKNLYREFH